MTDRARHSLARLVEAHYEELRAFVRRRVGSASAAQDVVQETWLRVAAEPAERAPEPPRPLAQARAYIYRVAGNLAIDRLRRDRLELRHGAGLPLPLEQPGTEPGPDRVVAAREEMAILRQAIQELPERCRDAFLLYRGEGLTMRETALRLGISEKTVEKHVAKAMLHCRRRLAEAGIEP
ncbi:RNA polymerase sigma-70 factor (ECF subfamily) [Stella humosa]|uniref:RNA polymerase sigma-70 factor (ECF subfamily) n=1 Tax=Stella humosa TaxID=94 RepID=A0A3N1LIT4_9PROT|nr:RNA polymerase sigma factor [Stella humosa]ROP90769.1 RNA polymerase sigma-70 factor (ECF subfamily) [Stella humosa]BBK34885.1 DNA-directed RNA polymerase sigma-70 factor [Stella humosa]